MVRPDRRPSRCVSWLLSLLHCPGHTQQEIADAVGVTQKTVDNRLESLVNLDRCPKLLKIAALFEEAMIKSYTDLDKCPKSVKIAALFEDD